MPKSTIIELESAADPRSAREASIGTAVEVGRVTSSTATPTKTARPQPLVLDGREVVLEADSTLTLRCGKSSITLTREGRIILRGTNLVSHASGVNRIRGGAIKLN